MLIEFVKETVKFAYNFKHLEGIIKHLEAHLKTMEQNNEIIRKEKEEIRYEREIMKHERGAMRKEKEAMRRERDRAIEKEKRSRAFLWVFVSISCFIMIGSYIIQPNILS